jgi:hypothetical protein
MGWDMAGVPTGHIFRVERVRGPVWYAKVPAAGRAPGAEAAGAGGERQCVDLGAKENGGAQ